MKCVGRWEDNVLHGKLEDGPHEHVVELPPRAGIGRARVAVVHGDGGGSLATPAVLLGRLVGHSAHQVDDCVHGDDVAYCGGVAVDCPVTYVQLSLSKFFKRCFLFCGQTDNLGERIQFFK